MLKKIKSIIGVLIIIFIVMGIFAVSINNFVIDSVKSSIYTFEEMSDIQADGYDCIIVLGAGVKGNNPSKILYERLKCGIKAYDMGIAPKLLMSGDHGQKDYDEVNVMKKIAVSSGIASEDVFMDHAGFSTYDTMYRAKEVFEVKKAVIVTQKYHLSRALYIAKSLGLECVGIACDTAHYRGERYRNARECVARVKDFFSVIIKPKPKYLGEVIPVSGNGNITEG